MEVLPGITYDGWRPLGVKKASPHELVEAIGIPKSNTRAPYNGQAADSLPKLRGRSCLFEEFKLRHFICREASLSF